MLHVHPRRAWIKETEVPGLLFTSCICRAVAFSSLTYISRVFASLILTINSQIFFHYTSVRMQKTAGSLRERQEHKSERSNFKCAGFLFSAESGKKQTGVLGQISSLCLENCTQEKMFCWWAWQLVRASVFVLVTICRSRRALNRDTRFYFQLQNKLLVSLRYCPWRQTLHVLFYHVCKFLFLNKILGCTLKSPTTLYEKSSSFHLSCNHYYHMLIQNPLMRLFTFALHRLFAFACVLPNEH